MDKFIRPHVFLKGHREKSFGLIGQANSFLQRTLNWDSNKQFVHSLKLVDGSLITIQRLMNGEFLTFIESSIPTGGVEEVCRFFTAIDTYDGTDIDIISDEDTRERIIVSVSSSGDVSAEKVQDGFELGEGIIEFMAGNIDFKGKYTWHGPLGKDLAPPLPLPFSNDLFIRSIGGYNYTPSPSGFFSYFHRYTTQVFLAGFPILDTTDNIISPDEFVLGYCNSGSYELVITWKEDAENDRQDSVWLVQNEVWTLLGNIDYYDVSDTTTKMYGRSQCITFNNNCDKFTGVIISSIGSILVEGSILLNSETNIPESINTTITPSIDFIERKVISISTNKLLKTDTYLVPETQDTTVDSILLDPIPISSVFLDDDSLNVLSITEFESSSIQEQRNTATLKEVEQLLGNLTHKIDISSSFSMKVESTTGAIFNLSGSRTDILDTEYNRDLPANWTEVTTQDIIRTEDTGSLVNFKYIDLKRDIYIYDIGEGSATTDITQDDDDSFGEQGTRVYVHDQISNNYNLVFSKLNRTDKILKTESLLERPDETSSHTTNTVAVRDGGSILNTANSFVVFSVTPPPTVNSDITSTTSIASIVETYAGDTSLYLGNKPFATALLWLDQSFPTGSGEFFEQGDGVAISSNVFSNTCNDTQVSLVSHRDFGSRFFEHPYVGNEFSDYSLVIGNVATEIQPSLDLLNLIDLTFSVSSELLVKEIDFNKLYSDLEIDPVPTLQRFWSDRIAHFRPTFFGSGINTIPLKTDTAIGLL